jgi:hypothetical protein
MQRVRSRGFIGVPGTWISAIEESKDRRQKVILRGAILWKKENVGQVPGKAPA